MRIQSKINRYRIGMHFVNILSELILFYLISVVFFDNYNFFVVLLFWIAYTIVIFVIGVVRWIAQIMYFNIKLKNHSIDDAYQFLVENKLPMPRHYESSAYDYLESVFTCNKLKCETRISAALHAGMLTYLSNHVEFHILNAYEQALLKYRQYCLDNGIKQINDDEKDEVEN